jgi:hypothetical protein
VTTKRVWLHTIGAMYEKKPVIVKYIICRPYKKTHEDSDLLAIISENST